MKLKSTYIIIALMAFALGGCRQQEVTEDMSDADKLEVLDIQIHRHPKDAELRYERSKIYLSLQRPKDAIFDLQRAIEIDDDNISYRLALADAYFANGDVENSYKTLSAADELSPDNSEVQLKMGEITFYSRDYDRSMENLSRVTEKDPENRTALFMKGFIYKEKGDTVSAVTLLRKVCDLYPDYEPAFEELGVLYATRHDPLAVEYLNTAMRLEPSNTNAIYALAMFYQDLKQMDNAETLYQQILSINPNSADALHNLGYIELFYYRDYPRAIDYMTRAINADSQYIEAYVNRGCAYELNNQPAEARADFEAALSLDSQYLPAIDGLKRVSK